MSKDITLIPARRKIGQSKSQNNENPKLKVAAYCRVSTDSEEQSTSYEAQVQHYREFISNNTDWQFAGIFADDGISGTNTKKRDGFNEMIEACLNGKVDMIVTKSISRFARNTIDCLKYVRLLRDKRVPIIFEKENINTMDASGELLLTIMASLAQQESESISKNVKMGYQFRFQQGKIQVNHKRFLGYDKDKEGNLVINEQQANVVKRIFKEYLEGLSFHEIKKGLERDGILNGANHKKWHASNIKGILQNEKYMGDALLQKTITTDFIEKTRKKNDGTEPQYYVKNSHPAIISREIFIRTQEELLRRSNLANGSSEGRKRNYSSKYALSGMCTCEKCGDVYRRIAWNNRGKKSIVWRCCTRVKYGPKACDAATIGEEVLQEAVVSAINQVVQISDKTIHILLQNIQKVISKDYANEIKEIQVLLTSKQELLLELIQSNQNYDNLLNEIDLLKAKENELLLNQANNETHKKRIYEMKQFIENQDHLLTHYDEAFVRKYIQEIKIFDDKFEVRFKSGINVNIEK